MKRVARSIFISALILTGLLCQETFHHGNVPMAAPSSPAKPAGQAASSNISRDEAEALEIKRQQLAGKEAALNAKEQELNKLAASLDARINEMNAARKAVEGSLQMKKKQENERYKKILKVYKALKPEEAGKLMDKLDEDMVIEMLNQMDQKTAVKLIPFLNQPRVLKWTRENLKGR